MRRCLLKYVSLWTMLIVLFSFAACQNAEAVSIKDENIES